MKRTKQANAAAAGISQEDIELINKLSKKKLSEEDVFTFEILLCDNDVDRDFERFSLAALHEMEKLFVGKTGIFDHQWTAEGQKARIFKTEVVTDNSKSVVSGEAYAYLKASAYMLRTEKNEELIAEIEGGIKRETSIGCGMSAGICSICSEEHGKNGCVHVKGREYGGRLCFVELKDPTDAYEWSFVAVPAQRSAGVLKKFGADMGDYGDAEQIYKLAVLGEQYLKGLREEVVRLGVLTDCGFEKSALEAAAERMEEKELLSFRKTFEKRLDEMLPPVCQLGGAKRAKPDFDGGEFLI